MSDDAYWAFISYSHADEAIARRVHRELERYRVPRRLVGRPGPHGPLPRRLLPVFRDRDELPSASDLSDKIQAALRRSRFLVVICSPKSAVSKWVHEEIVTFKAAAGEDRVLCLIVDGEPNASERPDSGQLECFPRAVRHRVDADGTLTEARAEPIAADARRDRDGPLNARLKLLAGMLGVSFDELKQRERRRRFWQRVRAVTAGVLVLAALGGVWRVGERARHARTAQLLVNKARDAAVRGDDDALASFYGAESIRYSLMAGTAPLEPDFLASLTLGAMPDGTPWSARLDKPVVLSPDGALLFGLTGGEGKVHDLRRGVVRASVPAEGGTLTTAIFDDANRYLATGTSAGGVQVWDAATGAPAGVAHQQGSRIRALVFSRDGEVLAGVGDDGTIKLWRRDRAAPVATLAAGEPVNCLAFSPDGRRLAAGGEQSLRVWALDRPATPMMIGEYGDPVRSLAFSPDGGLVAAGLWDSTVRLWDLDRRVELAALAGRSGHLESVESVAFAADGTLLASASLDRTVKLWEVSSQTLIATLAGHPDGVTAVAFGAGSDTLTSLSLGGMAGVKRWHVTPRKYRAALTGHTRPVRAVAFAPDGRVLASAAEDRTIRLWDVERRQPLRVLPTLHRDAIRALAFSPDGAWLASAGRDEQIVLWNTRTGAAVKREHAHDHWIFALAFTPDGRAVASAGWERDPTVKLWSVPDLGPLATLGRHKGPVGGLAASPAGAAVASASNDKTVMLWDVAARTGVPLSPTRPFAMRGIAFSPDGRLLAAGGAEGWLQLWDVNGRHTAGPAFKAHHVRGHETTLIWALAFSPDGRLLASGSNSLDRQTLRLWDVAQRRTIGWLTGHREFTVAVAFSPDGQWLASAGTDKTVRMWRVADFWPPPASETAASSGALLRGFLARTDYTLADAERLVRDVGHLTGFEMEGNEAVATHAPHAEGQPAR